MISVENVCKTFYKDENELDISRTLAVLEHVTFTAQEGEIIGITGDSGEGKTTLLRILMGLEQCDCGSIKGISGSRAAVFQEDRLIDTMNAVDNIHFVTNLPQNVILKHLFTVIPDLDPVKKVGNLSGGMRRRVCIVRAMITDAEFLFFDEPFKGLDEDSRNRTIQYVLSQKKQNKQDIHRDKIGRAEKQEAEKTIFVITHDKIELKLLGATQIIRLKERGEIAESV